MVNRNVFSGIRSWATFIFLLALTACDKNQVFEQYKSIPDGKWMVDNKIKFTVDINDTLTPYNFYVDIRHDEGYQYRNLFLFLRTTFPNGKFSRDTLECILADEKDHWLGHASFNLYDNKILFKRNVRFPLPGSYIFEIQHGMREDPLPSVVDVGLRIERTQAANER